MADDTEIRKLLLRRMEDFEREFSRRLNKAVEKALFERGNVEESPIFGGIDRSTDKWWRNNG